MMTIETLALTLTDLLPRLTIDDAWLISAEAIKRDPSVDGAVLAIRAACRVTGVCETRWERYEKVVKSLITLNKRYY